MKLLIHKPLSLITKTRIRGLDAFSEGLVLRLSLRVLNTLDVALVGVLERRADGDDTLP